MLLGGTKNEHFSCFHSSCQLGLSSDFLKMPQKFEREDSSHFYGLLRISEFTKIRFSIMQQKQTIPNLKALIWLYLLPQEQGHGIY